MFQHNVGDRASVQKQINRNFTFTFGVLRHGGKPRPVELPGGIVEPGNGDPARYSETLPLALIHRTDGNTIG